MFDRLKEGARRLVRNHGSEVGAVVKIAAHALLPGAPMLIGATEALCDYASEQGHEQGEVALMEELEALGGDVTHLEMMIEQMSGQLDGVIGMMTQSAKFGAPPQALEAMINSALETQFSELRDELRALIPELETVKRQGESLLRGQGLIGDAVKEVKHQLDVALAQSAPLAGEGVVGAQVSVFLGARGRFQSALINGDLEGAESALAEMSSISPNGNTVRVSEMALQSARSALKHLNETQREATSSPIESDINLGERIRHSFEGVIFYERIIPGVDGGHPFAIAETPVTQALFHAVTWDNPSEREGDLLPVEMVTWDDAISFCNDLSEELGLTPCYEVTVDSSEFDPEANGFRLPFETEWEWAARGGESFTYAGSDDLDEVGWYDDNADCESQPVAQKRPNGYGLYDMSGNVAEWCNNEYATPGEYNPEADDRAYRGGSSSSIDDDCALSTRPPPSWTFQILHLLETVDL